MTKPLPLSDFRAVRIILEPDDFALSPGEELPPFDLIAEDIWHGIMNLPDDVSVRTSNHHGRVLKELYELWEAWIEAVGATQDQLDAFLLDAADEFQAVTFNALHGYYRQALGNLRNALELITIGAYCHVCNKQTELAQWRAGQVEISFGKACDALRNAPAIQPLNLQLRSTCSDSLFDQKTKACSGGWARRLYADLSNYSHSRTRFTNADMWQSNGPIYVAQEFLRTTGLYLQVCALCFLFVKIARPSFTFPRQTLHLFVPSVGPWGKMAGTCYRLLFQLP